MPEWNQITIGDVAEVKGGKRLPKGMSLVSENNGSPYVRITDWYDGYIDTRNVMYVPEDALKIIDRYRIFSGDIFISIAGTIGRVALIGNELDGAFLTENAARISVRDQNMNPSFLRYILISTIGQEEVLKRTVGSTQPKLALHRIKDITVPYPPRSVQDSIAEVLGALDDKIAANAKLAQTAEDLLQSSYRGLINEVASQRVRVGSLVRRISPARKFTKSDLVPQGDFPVFDQSESGFLGYLNGEGYLDASTEHPLLYFGDHTCKLRIATQRFTVGPNTVPFAGLAIPSLTLYCALNGVQKLEEYKRHWLLMMEKEVLVPEAKEAEEFATRHRHLLTLFRSLNRENQQLAATRDALLPQLMSGKLKVKQAEEIIASAV